MVFLLPTFLIFSGQVLDQVGQYSGWIFPMLKEMIHNDKTNRCRVLQIVPMIYTFYIVTDQYLTWLSYQTFLLFNIS